MDSVQKKVIVVGTGFSGLVTGFYLVEQGFSVQFFEKNQKVGGLLGSLSTERGVVEQAANAFLATKELERISQSIGITLFEKKAEAEKRYIYRGGRPRRWPLGFFASLSVLWFLIRYTFFKKKLKPQKNESLRGWGLRSFGKEATEYLLSPAMQGVYGVGADKLSASLVLKNIFSGQKLQKGLLKGSVSPRSGMGAWVEAMKLYLESQACQFSTGASWDFLKKECPVVLATDLDSAKRILKDCKDPRASLLGKLESLSLTSVTVHWDESNPSLISGFGCLFPKEEGFYAMGVLNNGGIFEGRAQGCHSETWIFNDDKVLVSELPEEKLIEYIYQDREKMGFVRGEALASYCFQWSKAIPHYSLEMERQLENLELEEGNLFLMGNYLGPLGLSRILTLAKRTAESVSEKGKWQKQQ